MTNIFRKVEEFTVDLNYLPIQEARVYLKELKQEEITEHKESLSQIRKIMSDTLVEETLNDYAIQEIESFLEELKQTEQSIASKVI
jgi:uncharacterized protein (UPF0297 family)